MVGGGRGAPQKRGAEKEGSQRNDLQGNWCVPKAGMPHSASAGVPLQHEKTSNMDVNPCCKKSQAPWECPRRRGQGGDRGLRPFPLPPCRLRRGDSPATKNTAPLAGESCCINKSTALLERPAVWSRSCARQYEAGRKSYLGGASADAQSYWQGRFAACAFVDFPFVMVTRGTVGALPQTLPEALSLDPARGRRKGTKSPLDPFLAPQLERFSLTGSSSTL